MTELLKLDGYNVHALLASQPVPRAAYQDYLRASGQPLPPAVTQTGPSTSPVTHISQTDAQAYCRWAGGREGRVYRLPTMAELQALYAEDAADGITLEVWGHTSRARPELYGGSKDVFLCEWTGEIEEVPQPGGRSPRILGSIFYPPWLRHGSNAIQAQAHLLATEGYSFVTFRLAADG